MNEINRKRIKRAAISWLCVAALAAAAVPTEMTGFITPMTVWNEDNAVSAVTAELVGRNYIRTCLHKRMRTFFWQNYDRKYEHISMKTGSYI